MDRIINMVIAQITRIFVRKGVDLAGRQGTKLFEKAAQRKKKPSKVSEQGDDDTLS